MSARKVLLANAYIDALCQRLGLPADRINKIVIEAEAGSAVWLHVRYLGDDRMLEVSDRLEVSADG